MPRSTFVLVFFKNGNVYDSAQITPTYRVMAFFLVFFFHYSLPISPRFQNAFIPHLDIFEMRKSKYRKPKKKNLFSSSQNLFPRDAHPTPMDTTNLTLL
jgi:hypothetical protein